VGGLAVADMQPGAVKCGRRPLVTGYSRDDDLSVSAGRGLDQASAAVMRWLAISSSPSMQFA